MLINTLGAANSRVWFLSTSTVQIFSLALVADITNATKKTACNAVGPHAITTAHLREDDKN